MSADRDASRHVVAVACERHSHVHRLRLRGGTRRARNKIKWDREESRLQSWVNSASEKCKALRRLREARAKVRPDLKLVGCDQTSLDQPNSLTVIGVIYAIVCVKTMRFYVGQTSKSAMHRFREHVCSSLAGGKETLHKAMRRHGWTNFRVLPLEVISPSMYPSKGKYHLRDFRAIANVREKFWVERLHSWSPVGYNDDHLAKRKTTVRTRVSNPMKWARAKRLASEPAKVIVAPLDTPKNVKKASQRLFGGRDYSRRFNYLSHRYSLGTFNTINWEAYALNTLRGLLRWIRANPTKVIHHEIRLKIESLLYDEDPEKRIRSSFQSVPKPSRPYIRVEWTSHLLRHVRLREILLNPLMISRLPVAAQSVFDDDFLVVKKLPRAIGLTVLNYTKVARELSQPTPSEDCPCRKFFPARFRPEGKCVNSGDLAIVKHSGLKKLLSYGPNFRDRNNLNPMDSVRSGLDGFIASQSNETGTDRTQFLEWRQAVLAACEQRLPHYTKKATPQLEEKGMRKYLRFLHRHLVLVPVDKAASNIGFCCKALYVNTLLKELETPGGAYTECKDPKMVETLLKVHTEHLYTRRLDGEKRLPYLYWMPKFHKSPPGQRFIAAAGNCTTTRLSATLSDILLHILRTLRAKDDELIRKTGVRRFFVVETYEEVSSFLAQWKRQWAQDKFRGLYTGDFSTMYTAIPHADLLDAVKVAVEEAFMWQAEKEGTVSEELVLRCSKTRGAKTVCFAKSSRGTRGTAYSDRSQVRVFTKEQILADVAFLLSNTYLVHGKGKSLRVFQQVIGIPMGTNCSPALANTYLYKYESRFIDALLSRSLELARRFHATFRYIDDLLSADNRHWKEAISKPAEEGGLYPRALQLNNTSLDEMTALFLGMEIVALCNTFRIQVYDKRKSFPFHVVRYPHMDSLIPRNIPYGVFLGQLHRGYRICTEATGFVQFASDVASRLLNNGCKQDRLLAIFRGFLKAKVSKFSTSHRTLVRKFASWGTETDL